MKTILFMQNCKSFLAVRDNTGVLNLLAKQALSPFEPLCQLFFVMGFFKIGSQELLAGF
jgi:hypothetical protein